MEGTAEPDYKRCIAISTQAALREMILPGVLTVYCRLHSIYPLGKAALGGVLVGATRCWCVLSAYDGKWWWRMG